MKSVSRAARIQELLEDNFSKILVQIEDESGQHSRGGQETHLKLLLISDEFHSQTRIQRQRKINELLNQELQSGLHALSLRCLTSAEAESQSLDFQSPPCASVENKK